MDDLDRLHHDLGLGRLRPGWAKGEIVLGLAAVAAGVQVGGWAGGGLLVLGGYLALAGQRSLLYQSNNRLAAHLAGLVRRDRPPDRPDEPAR